MALNPDVLEEAEECSEGAPAWMATFSDLATLLLTFFVLLLSFAQLDAKQFRDALGSVREALGVSRAEPGRFEARSTTIVEVGKNSRKDVLGEASALRMVKNAVAKRGLQDVVEVIGEKRGVVVRMNDHVVFDTGSDKVSEQGISVLVKLVALINDFDGRVAIEGHTDNRPIRSAKFPSNWELSALRSTAVLRHFVTHGVPRERLSIAGYADNSPIASNDTADGRARNRRVEFIFVYDGLKPKDQDDTAGSAADAGADADGTP